MSERKKYFIGVDSYEIINSPFGDKDKLKVNVGDLTLTFDIDDVSEVQIYDPEQHVEHLLEIIADLYEKLTVNDIDTYFGVSCFYDLLKLDYDSIVAGYDKFMNRLEIGDEVRTRYTGRRDIYGIYLGTDPTKMAITLCKNNGKVQLCPKSELVKTGKRLEDIVKYLGGKE